MNTDLLWKAGIARYVRRISLAGLAVLAGCATPPEPAPRVAHEVIPAEPAPAAAAQVFVYPSGGQSAAQLDRDKYECHAWAVKQSNFDPSQPQVPPHERVQVVAMGPPPGSNTVAGAATGAIIGAAVSRPRDAGGGALVGAVAGAILGATADAANQQRVETVQKRVDQRDLRAQAQLEMRAHDYRRAISACLEGRGYTVK